MGTTYGYRCESCGFAQEYSIGGGFFTEEYYEKSELLKEEFCREILSGKYGNVLKEMLRNDTDGELSLFCGTELLQCDCCRTVRVDHIKRIVSCPVGQHPYELDVCIPVTCTVCRKGKLRRKSNEYILPCPGCNDFMKLISISKWD